MKLDVKRLQQTLTELVINAEHFPSQVQVIVVVTSFSWCNENFCLDCSIHKENNSTSYIRLITLEREK